MNSPEERTRLHEEANALLVKLNGKVKELNDLLETSSPVYESGRGYYYRRSDYSSASTHMGGGDSVQITGLRSEIDGMVRSLFPFQQVAKAIVPDTERDLDDIVIRISEKREKQELINPAVGEREKWNKLLERISNAVAAACKVMGSDWRGPGIPAKSSPSIAFSPVERKQVAPSYLLQGVIDSVLRPQYALPPNPRMTAGDSRGADLVKKLEHDVSQELVDPPLEYVPRSVYSQQYDRYRS